MSSDLQVKNPQVQVEMDRDKISTLGLTVNQVETALYNSYGTRQVSTIYAPNNQYQVRSLWLILIMAIVVIYIVLGILYESFTHPLTILSGLPSRLAAPAPAEDPALALPRHIEGSRRRA